jgi:hypothetical protein
MTGSNSQEPSSSVASASKLFAALSVQPSTTTVSKAPSSSPVHPAKAETSTVIIIIRAILRIPCPEGSPIQIFPIGLRLSRTNRSRLVPPDRAMGSLEFMGIPNWLAFAVIGLVFILLMRDVFF